MAVYSFPKSKQDESKKSKLRKLLEYIYPSTPQEAVQGMTNPMGLGMPIYLTRSPSALIKILAEKRPEYLAGLQEAVTNIARRGGSAAIFPDYPKAVEEGIKDAAIFINPLSKVNIPGATKSYTFKNPPGESRLLHELGHVAHAIYDPRTPMKSGGARNVGVELSAWLPFLRQYPHRAAEAIEPISAYAENAFGLSRNRAMEVAKELVNYIIGGRVSGGGKASFDLNIIKAMAPEVMGLTESFAKKLSLPKNALEIARERIRMAGLRPHIEMGVEKLRELKNVPPAKIMEILLQLKR